MKIVILDADTISNGDVSLDPITSLGDAKVYDLKPAEELPAIVKDAEVLLCNKAEITEQLMDACENLRFVGVFATGYNNIDLAAAKARGITVCNVPGYSTEAVAQHTFALILSLAGSIPQYTASVHAGDWVRSKQFTYFKFPQTSLCGKTLGIFGYGAIGQRVAEIGRAFGMKILVHTRSPHKCPAVETVSAAELFSRADVLTFHCPLNEQNKGIIDKKHLSLMKPSAFLINTARGGLMDEQAVADALHDGTIAGAGIDVVAKEPMLSDNPLLTAKNCILTPHIAWAPPDVRENLVQLVADNIIAFQNGTPINVVR